ncbi:UNVERIFIED_CONTAM: hypothetical protein KB570_07570 [Streptococcus canis]|nr:hypothetical protein [Streptococcus canis]
MKKDRNALLDQLTGKKGTSDSEDKIGVNFQNEGATKGKGIPVTANQIS